MDEDKRQNLKKIRIRREKNPNILRDICMVMSRGYLKKIVHRNRLDAYVSNTFYANFEVKFEKKKKHPFSYLLSRYQIKCLIKNIV